MSMTLKTMLIGAVLLIAQTALAQSVIQQYTHPAMVRAQQKAFVEHAYLTDYAFEIRYQDEEISAHAYVNPMRPKGKRIDVFQPARSEWNDDFRNKLSDFDTNPYEEFWCADFLALVGPDIHPVAQDGNSVIFAFSPQANPNDGADDRKFLSGMIAHLTINQTTGAIEKFEMRNRRPFKPIFIAKIKSFRMEAHCQPAPDGRDYVSSITTDLSAKIALKKVVEHEERQVFNLTLAQ